MSIKIAKILMDIGSSTVKVYEQKSNGNISLVLAKSISFKEDFDPANGLKEEYKTELFELISEVQKKSQLVPIKIYATALYRKLEPEAKRKLIDDVYEKTGLFFNIIEHDLENFYLQTALTGKYKAKNNILLINIGGGSTELVVVSENKVIEIKNIDLGVGTILTDFSGINEPISKHKLEKVVNFCKTKLPTLKNKVNLAFYSGGELTYMKLAGYNLQNNSLFKDNDHPSILQTSDFKNKNKEIFSIMTIKNLEDLMPENPTWMHGARACSALAEAICEKYNIVTIVPSNSNLIDGVVRQEFRYVTLSGSFRKHLEFILKIREKLVDKNVQVLSPRFVEAKNPGEEFIVFSGEEDMTPLELERHHLKSIEKSDALIVCDPEGYVGASALIEIGYAQKLGKRIIFVHKPEEFMLNTLPAEIGL